MRATNRRSTQHISRARMSFLFVCVPFLCSSHSRLVSETSCLLHEYRLLFAISALRPWLESPMQNDTCSPCTVLLADFTFPGERVGSFSVSVSQNLPAGTHRGGPTQHHRTAEVEACGVHPAVAGPSVRTYVSHCHVAELRTLSVLLRCPSSLLFDSSTTGSLARCLSQSCSQQADSDPFDVTEDRFTNRISAIYQGEALEELASRALSTPLR
jgi:hypothetical protein